MTISKMSKKYNISADTLRYYERVGLLPSVNRNESGFRDYTPDDEKWLEFILCMRSAGMPIEALIEYVSLFSEGEQTLAARKEILEEQREKLKEKIKELNSTFNVLDAKIKRYENWAFEADERLRKPAAEEVEK